MTDVFPLRNLPPEAEEWGRTVEDRIIQAENRNATAGQSLSGLNRSSSSTLDNLAFQVSEVNRLYRSLPIGVQVTSSNTNFAVPASTPAWNTIAVTTLSPPAPGTYQITSVASGQLRSGGASTLATADYRLITNSGQSSPVVAGLWASPTGVFVNNFLVNWGWTLPATEGTPITIYLQSSPGDGAMWPAGTGSYAVITTYGTFARA